MRMPRRAKILTLGFGVLSLLLSVFASFVVLSQSGYARATPFCVASVYIAFWPSLLLGFDRGYMFFALIPFVVNCIGWALVGCVLGLFARANTRDATPTI